MQEHNPPGTSQYNGVAERASGLMKEKAVAILEDVTEGSNDDKLLAEPMGMACDMSYICITTANEGGMSSYRIWYGTTSTPTTIQPFGTQWDTSPLHLYWKAQHEAERKKMRYAGTGP